MEGAERCEDLQLSYLLPWQEWLQELGLVRREWSVVCTGDEVVQRMPRCSAALVRVGLGH